MEGDTVRKTMDCRWHGCALQREVPVLDHCTKNKLGLQVWYGRACLVYVDCFGFLVGDCILDILGALCALKEKLLWRGQMWFLRVLV